MTQRFALPLPALLLLTFALCPVIAMPLTLPEPRMESDVSLEQALRERRSARDFSGQTLGLPAVGQLLWAAQGVSHAQGFRTTPSAGALYPLEVYLLPWGVDAVADGTYRYLPPTHTLERRAANPAQEALAAAALGQEPVLGAAAVVVISGTVARTSGKYGRRAERYVWMEAGHAAQNLLLQATALGLGAVAIGAFDDRRVAELLGLPEGETPLYLLAIGVPLNE